MLRREASRKNPATTTTMIGTTIQMSMFIGTPWAPSQVEDDRVPQQHGEEQVHEGHDAAMKSSPRSGLIHQLLPSRSTAMSGSRAGPPDHDHGPAG